MPSAAKLFYLTLFSLWQGPAQCKSANSRPADDACSIAPGSIISDACVTYSNLEDLNTQVKPAIEDLIRNTDFFSHYRLNLFSKTCPFWDDENGMCGNQACAVNTIDDEKDVPLVWRAEELSKLEGPKAEHPGKTVQKERPQRPLQGSLGEDVGESCVVEYDDECDERDYCVPEDESASAKGVYVSLVQNPERFTGYRGESANMVWDAIYRENCFKKSSFPKSAGLGLSPFPGPAEQDFRAVLQSVGRQQPPGQDDVDALEYEDECLEKRVFYRVVSGMHSSISTHICWDFLNQTTGQWGHNLQCYVDRLHTHPERISNLYFNFAMVTRAISKIGPYLQSYTFCTGDRDQDTATKAKVTAVVQAALKQPEIFDESLMFKNGEGPSLKQEFKDNFRNISRIMDCTSCDKCRLWGKLQVAGYGAALKVLFEFDNDSGEVPLLKRTELVALFNLYARLSSSVNAITKFRAMLEDEAVAGAPVQEQKTETVPDRAKKPHAIGLGQSKAASQQQASTETSTKAASEDEWAGYVPTPKGAVGNSLAELASVWRVFKYIMTSFVYLPRFTWHAFLYEADRVYRSYIGMYVPPREPYFSWPDVNEIVHGDTRYEQVPKRSEAEDVKDKSKAPQREL
ncbi:endoplasmic reticulum Oxidoreductin 1-domain-containing protein [Truncatella angustata]|uniref:Endoplasmic reticulum Oxidoreductin 1-domain-containing protein n=1 Tax=Truncatella angustata TaxID=152316 RepID=A0A9P8UTA8_9PEZI|nr:endoplasmic reticulum Oxidoreductin 1-domain-containing protein [Truncatella angustata]KAH6657781.1 endoplasmic reticulum Oxidoreductin 1-domain-containing protein [Truncatella angustata]